MTRPLPPSKDEAQRLLLYSLADFWPLIEPLLQIARPGALCEIGIGAGEFTARLLKFCGENSCGYSGIDPVADQSKIPVPPGVPARLISQPSLSALATLAPQDVYFLDGDHNYYTVSRELRLILQTPQHWPLVILHDVGWPWGRRDHYCSPENIPAEFRHPYSTNLGVRPERNELGPDGFSGESSAYAYGAAGHEGGPRNGVLTAIEDFLCEPAGTEWRLLAVPAIFGLGILHAPEHCAAGVRAHLANLAQALAPVGPMLELLERNRVDLFLAHLRNVQSLAAIHDSYESLARHARSLQNQYEGLLEQYRKLEAHSGALAATFAELNQHCQALQAAHDELRRAAKPEPQPPPQL